MSKIEEVRADMVKAMKAGEKDTKETLSMLLAALKNKAIDKRSDLTPEEEVQVILKEIKQTKETLEMTPPERTEIISECSRRLAVLEQYAPKMMDEAGIKEIISETLSEIGIETPTAKDKGRIMKVLMPKVKGKADGKLVNDILMSILQEPSVSVKSLPKPQEPGMQMSNHLHSGLLAICLFLCTVSRILLIVCLNLIGIRLLDLLLHSNAQVIKIYLFPDFFINLNIHTFLPLLTGICKKLGLPVIDDHLLLILCCLWIQKTCHSAHIAACIRFNHICGFI